MNSTFNKSDTTLSRWTVPDEENLSPATLEQVGPEAARSYDRLVKTRRLLQKLYNMRRIVDRQLETENNIVMLCELIDQHSKLSSQLEKLEQRLDFLRWENINRLGIIGVADGTSARLSDICQGIGYSIGQLSAFGAALSISLLYSAVRGSLWGIYLATWCFLSALCITGALSVISAGSDASSITPTRANWVKRAVGVAFIIFAFFCMVCGLGFLGVALVVFDVKNELHGQAPAIFAGPAFTGEGPRKETVIGTYVLLGAGALLFVGGLVSALSPQVRVHKAKKRRLRSKFFTSEAELKRRHRSYSHDAAHVVEDLDSYKV